MRILVDTNRYRDFCMGEAEALRILQTADQIMIPFIVVAELRAGFACGSKGPENEKILTRFLNRPRVTLLFPDEDTTRHYANLFRQLRTNGTPIPTNDLWIAALAVQYDALLLTSDDHFRKIPQIPLI
jgi:tRNA(fMet)-specific endonuclease VapC